MHKPHKRPSSTTRAPATAPATAPAPATEPPHRSTPRFVDRFDAFAIAAPGLAPLVAAELSSLDIVPRELSDAGVAFDATGAELFRANLWLRTATRVIVRLASFDARDFATLERESAKVAWASVFDSRVKPAERAALRVTCRKSRLYHSDAVAERVARGIERAVGVSTAAGTNDDDSEESDTALESQTQRIIVRIDHDRCTISADSSGALLHRRGWRLAVAKAPLRETLAAALIEACDWREDEALVDPFCGSGTIGIEAALRARVIAPGIARAFRMERWLTISPRTIRESREEASAMQHERAPLPIIMSDRDAGAVAAARANAVRARVSTDVTVEQRALSEVNLADIAQRGLVLINPPYGVRVSDSTELRPLYSRLGEIIREAGNGWRLGMIVNDARVARYTGLRMREVLRTKNGGLPVTMLVSEG